MFGGVGRCFPDDVRFAAKSANLTDDVRFTAESADLPARLAGKADVAVRGAAARSLKYGPCGTAMLVYGGAGCRCGGRAAGWIVVQTGIEAG